MEEMELSFRLYLLYFLLILLSVIATLLCALLIHLLRKYDVFHINFRTILWNILFCVLVNNVIQCIRPFIAIYQGLGQEIDDDVEYKTCSELNVLPVPFCVFITVSGVIMCVERLYATFNYAKYEYENYSWVFDRIFMVMWVIFVVCSLGNVFDYTSHTFNYFECSFIQIAKNPLKTHWHILFTAVFQAVYLVVFSSVVNLNKEKQTVYIKHYYNSLSPRFQIGENIKATRLLVNFTIVIFLAMLIIMSHQFLQYRDFTQRSEASFFWQEISLLIMPLFTMCMSLTFLIRSHVFFAKTRLFIKELLQSYPRLLRQEVEKSVDL
ncbi:unnamed protein product [Bursaphelenchus xylophilus]|uniref:(pine wood nematode) hypothetical protein n=1 Tax=Bursaphelenchus xylophilus TaxID=6326 RepID=A0A1I7S515_BURXY|nr:unnamed protein product [Bursaphelenchus xylophilus]CAG9117598.1 unnamed protein product [Bursaphelenchus xylophilus]